MFGASREKIVGEGVEILREAVDSGPSSVEEVERAIASKEKWRGIARCKKRDKNPCFIHVSVELRPESRDVVVFFANLIEQVNEAKMLKSFVPSKDATSV